MSAWAELCECEAYTPTPADLALERALKYVSEWLALAEAEQLLDCQPNPFAWAAIGKGFFTPAMRAHLDRKAGQPA